MSISAVSPSIPLKPPEASVPKPPEVKVTATIARRRCWPPCRRDRERGSTSSREDSALYPPAGG